MSIKAKFKLNLKRHWFQKDDNSMEYDIIS